MVRPAAGKKSSLFSYENKLAVLFMFTIGLVCFDRLAINFLIPYIQEDLELNNTQVGMLVAAAALTWSLTAIIGGRLSDKVRSKRNYLVVLIIAFSLASMLQGFAGSFVHLVILRLLMGVFEGPVAPVSQSVLAIESSPHRRGFNLGMAMSTGQGLFGAILAPIVVVALAEQFDWRNAFFFTMIPGLILAGFVWKIMREPEAQDADGQAFATELHEGHSRSDISTVLRNRNVMLGVTMFTGFMIFAMVFQVYSPLYLTTVHGLSPTVMSFVMASFGVGAALWGFTVPLISDYIGRKPTAFFFALISAFGPFVVIYLDEPIVLAISMFVFSAGMAVGGMSANRHPGRSGPAEHGRSGRGNSDWAGRTDWWLRRPVDRRNRRRHLWPPGRSHRSLLRFVTVCFRCAVPPRDGSTHRCQEEPGNTGDRVQHPGKRAGSGPVAFTYRSGSAYRTLGAATWSDPGQAPSISPATTTPED